MRKRPSPGLQAVLSAVIFCGFSLSAQGDDPPSAESLLARLRAEGSPAWSDGDIATFVFQGEADRVSVLLGGEPLPRDLTWIPGSDVWTIQFKKPRLDEAVFTYRLLSARAGRLAGESAASWRTWRGPKAPPAPEVRAKLKGVLDEEELASKALGTSRKVTTYRPPGHDRSKPSPVVYMTDGQSVEDFARVLEPMVAAGRVPAVVIVGVHNGGYLGPPPKNPGDYDGKKDLRSLEYVPGLDAKRFADHETFFVEEVPAWAERRFGVSAGRTDRAIFGYSNGGRFAAEMSWRHPDVFGHAFSFSVAGDATASLPKTGTAGEPVRFYLAAGTWEVLYHRFTAKLGDAMKARGAPVTFSSRVGGHDIAMWREEFAAAVASAFGGRRLEGQR